MMDQLEFENLIEKIKKRKEEGDYDTAAIVADKIPWDEVTDINVIMYVANIYEKAERYKDAKLILEYAYEIAPVKNRLFYALSYINVICKDLKNGIKYYIDFVNAFPDDIRKYVLMYEVLKIKGATLEQQKRVLDSYLKEENDERLIFEMAILCDRLKEKENVIYYTDYLVNFYGIKKNGYGSKALLLKKKYVDLTEYEEKLLLNAEIGYLKDDEKDKEIEYSKNATIVNATKLKEEYISVPVEKVDRAVELSEENKKLGEEIDEKKIDNSLSITYLPDQESYDEKEKNNMAFLNKNAIDKERLRKMISKMKAEEELEKSPFNEFRKSSFKRVGREKMRLGDTKVNMIIEANSKAEGVEIAKEELKYIHKVLGDEASIAKVSVYNLNEKGFEHYIDKLDGKDLIIEGAGQLKNEVLDDIEEYILNKKGSTIFALTDMINNFDKLAMERPSFINRFDVYSVLSERPQEVLVATKQEIDEYKEEHNIKKEKKSETKKEVKKENYRKDDDGTLIVEKRQIENKNMPIDEFVNECRVYAKSIDCVLGGDTIPALYEKVEEMQEEKIPLTKENAIALIEEAADRAERKRLFSKPQYDKDGCLVIKEEHFAF